MYSGRANNNSQYVRYYYQILDEFKSSDPTRSKYEINNIVHLHSGLINFQTNIFDMYKSNHADMDQIIIL